MKICLKKICFGALLLALSFNCISQDDAAIKTAFENSYIYEKSYQYSIAITKMKAVYDENSYEINLRLGYLCYENAAYREAANYYKKAVALKPNSIEAKLGYVYPLAALLSWDTVKLQYEEILKLDPNNSTANYRMGLIYYYKADYQTAITYFQKVYTAYPFDYSNTLMTAWTNLRMEKYVEAKTLFNTVLMILPNDTSSLRGLKLLK